MGKSTISMAISNSYVSHYQRVMQQRSRVSHIFKVEIQPDSESGFFTDQQPPFSAARNPVQQNQQRHGWLVVWNMNLVNFQSLFPIILWKSHDNPNRLSCFSMNMRMISWASYRFGGIQSMGNAGHRSVNSWVCLNSNCLLSQWDIYIHLPNHL